MDRTVKVPYWDFTELENGGIRTTDGISESSGFGDSTIKGGFMVDLKLGQVIDAGIESGQTLNSRIVSKTELSPPGSSKRARSVNNTIQSASCLVDGCEADLSVCGDYHRRHKVCEPHSKTPQVTINGRKQRFCQQCSRFHSLEEFDEGKRSCRKRLDGHNRRRRKPPAEPLSSSGTLSPTLQGATIWNFSAQHAYPANAISHPIWAEFAKSQEDINEFSNSRLARDNVAALCKSRDRAPPEPLSRLPVQRVGSSGTRGDGGNRAFCDGPEARFVRSGRARSLLSSSPLAQTSSTGPCHASRPEAEPVEPEELVLASNSSDASEGTFRALSAGDYESPQALPFFWE